MDIPTRIGLGETALFTVAGSAQPLFGWWVSGPLMALCAGVAAWGFWPLLWSAQIPLGLRNVSGLRDMTMTECFHTLNEASKYPAFEDALHQALYDGAVLAWGRRQLGRFEEDGRSPYQLIDKNIWLSGRFDWTTIGPSGTERTERRNEEDYAEINSTRHRSNVSRSNFRIEGRPDRHELISSRRLPRQKYPRCHDCCSGTETQRRTAACTWR